MPAGSTRGAFRCPGCGTTSVVATTCDTCALPMLDANDHETATTVRRLPLPSRRAVEGTSLAVFLGVNAAWVAAQIYWLQHDSALRHGLWIAGCFGLTTAMLLGTSWIARRVRKRAAVKLRAWPEAPPVEPVEAVSGGVVALRGRVRSVGRVLERDGQACVAATVDRATGPLSPSLVTHVTTFELESATGERTRVHAGRALVADGEASVVPVGAEVIVRGVAKRVASGAAGGDYRAAASVVELEGTDDEPLRIRVLDPAPAPAVLAVRVRAEATEEAELGVERPTESAQSQSRR